MMLLGSGCGDEAPEELSRRPDVSMGDLSDALVWTTSGTGWLTTFWR
jgi:hypothetical protein